MQPFLRIFLLGMLSLIIISQFGFAQGKNGFSSNPFFTASTLPYQAPAFDKIKDAHFKPALEEGMKQQDEEIEKIVSNPAAPSFENTLIAMEKSGRLLTRTDAVFDLFTGANTNPELQKIKKEEEPKLTAHQDNIYLNRKLFERIEILYKKRESLKTDAESKRLIEFIYLKFLQAGARLSDQDKTKLKKINEEEIVLKIRFSEKLLAATKAGGMVISDSSELTGLSQNNLDAYAQDDTQYKTKKWLIPLQNTTQQPALQSLSNRKTREALFEASWIRAEKGDSNDTRSVIAELARVRVEKANLLGFPNYASWKLQDQMARTPENVENFLSRLVRPATKSTKEEAAVIQTLINNQNAGFTLAAWDWNYFSEKVRKEKYDLNEDEVKPYFELYRVQEDGLFYAAHLLYGIRFTERHDLPVYQKDVRVYEVFDENNQSLALFYCDYFKRDNKSGGAWNNNLVKQSILLGTKPVIYNVCNFTKPAPGQPALISLVNVTTMFHEFGHALHGMFSNLQYASLSGSGGARDFVEFPSQFNEHWALDPKILKHYAIHYKTGQVIPDDLLQKIKNAAVFNQVYNLTEVLAAASLDMEWHMLTAKDSLQNVDTFEIAALNKTQLNLPEVPSRYRTSYFSHIWASDYASGYYAYLWTKMLAEDIFSWFEENGGLTRANGQRLREMILSRGTLLDYDKMFRDFRGRDPQINPMLKFYGLPLQ